MDSVIKHKIFCLNSYLHDDILYHLYHSLKILYKLQVKKNYNDTVSLLNYVYQHKNINETILQYIRDNKL